MCNRQFTRAHYLLLSQPIHTQLLPGFRLLPSHYFHSRITKASNGAFTGHPASAERAGALAVALGISSPWQLNKTDKFANGFVQLFRIEHGCS